MTLHQKRVLWVLSLLPMALLAVSCVDLRQPPELAQVHAPSGPPDAGPGPQPDAREVGLPDGEPWPATGDTTGPAPDADADPPDLETDTAPPPPGPPDAETETPVPSPPDAADTPVLDMAPKLLANGLTCQSGPQCESGICTEGICCNQLCGSPCHSCKVISAPGVCTPVPSGQDPKTACPAAAAETCGNLGGCDGAGACRPHPAGTVCAPPSCSAGIETASKQCDSNRQCLPSAIRACSPYTCNGSTCGTSCTTSGQCSAGNSCFGGACVPTANLPVLAWRLDETQGPTAFDSSPSGLHGVFVGAVGLPSPSTDVPTLKYPNPRSRSFLRDSRHAVQLPAMPSALKPSNNFTVTAWYRATSVDPGQYPPSADIVSGGDQYVLRVRQGDVQFAKHITAAHVKVDGVVGNHLDGKWHHLAGVTSSSGMKIYFDGVERGSNNIGDPVDYDRGSDLWVGRHGNAQTVWDFEGNIDEVRFYPRVLSSAEIAALAAGGN